MKQGTVSPALCRWPAAGQDASAVHPQSAHTRDAHAGADSWKPLAISPGHVSSGAAHLLVLSMMPISGKCTIVCSGASCSGANFWIPLRWADC